MGDHGERNSVQKQRISEWNTSVNLAANKNEVVDLSAEGINSGAGVPQFLLTQYDNTYGSVVRQGGSYGDIISFVAFTR